MMEYTIIENTEEEIVMRLPNLALQVSNVLNDISIGTFTKSHGREMSMESVQYSNLPIIISKRENGWKPEVLYATIIITFI